MSDEPQGGRRCRASRARGRGRHRAARLAAYLQAGGVIVPVLTAVLAFFIAGLVILFTGHNPLSTYKAIFNGTGLNWFFPWVTGDERATAALNLQQTLIITTPLILTGLAVAFAFRCGLFNIGGQGQYLVGTFVAVWVGSSFAGMPKLLHVVLAMVAARWPARSWAGIAGLLKAMVGAHEVISTIMLNWIAIWVGSYLFALHGPLQNSDPSQQSVPVSNDVAASAKLHVFWGDPELQGLHIGLFIALAAWSSSGSSSTARRPATRCARSASTPRPRATAASTWGATTSW